MKQEQDAGRDWTYSAGKDEPLWTPPDMPRGPGYRGRGRIIGVVLAVALGLLLIVGGGTLALMSSYDDPNTLAEEELNRLMASRTSLSETSDSATSDQELATRSASPSILSSPTLSVFSDPSNATVLIDYDSVGVTPVRDHALPPGVYILSVVDGDDVRLDTVIVVKDSGPQRTIAIDLSSRADASLDEQLAENEDGAGAGGNDEDSPAEPAERLPVAADSPRQESATPERTRESRETRQPPPARRNVTSNAGSMSISSTPEGAEVRIDGEVAGVTPLRLPRVLIGEHTVSLHLENHRTVTSSVDVRPSQTASVHERLRLAVGEVTIRVKPWGTIYIDGELHGRDLDVQYVTELTAGTHRITVFHPAFPEREHVVNVEPDGSHHVTIDLTAGSRATSDRQ